MDWKWKITVVAGAALVIRRLLLKGPKILSPPFSLWPSFCPQVKTLDKLIGCIKKHMPKKKDPSITTGRSWRDPGTNEIDDWKQAVRGMLDGNANLKLCASLKDIYQLKKKTYEGREYWILIENKVENSDCVVDRGWGTFIVNPNATRELCIQIPHPLSDSGTPEQGIAVFKGTGARCFLMAGTNRKASDKVGTCQTAYKETDVAHNINNLFHQATVAILEYYEAANKDFTVLQFHGMKKKRCKDINVYMTWGLNEPPSGKLSTLISELQSQQNTWNIIAPMNSSSPCTLNGTDNVQGRLLNGVPNGSECNPVTVTVTGGRFIHIEQDPGVYRTDTDTWVTAICNAWP